MNNILYRQYLQEYMTAAVHQSNRTTPGVYTVISEQPLPGFLTRHREEKTRAILDLREMLDSHRHWPLDIVLSHLNLNPKEILGG